MTRGWAGNAAIAAKTVVVLLAALQLLQLLGVTRVELARADTRTEVVGAPAVTDKPSSRPVREKLTSQAAAALQAPPAGAQRANRDLGRRLAGGKGWTGRQWLCLDVLWWRESNWRETAQNPSSTAYGIPQFLDKTWAGVGARKTADPAGQIQAGLTYVERRYSDPCSAWAFWLRQKPGHWY